LLVSAAMSATSRNVLAGLVAVSGSLFLAGCIISDDDNTITILNDSRFALVDIAIDDGRNLIEGDLLLPGESISVDISCGDYEVFVEAEDGFSCTTVVDVCFGDEDLVVITNRFCDAFPATGGSESDASAPEQDSETEQSPLQQDEQDAQKPAPLI